MVFIGTKSFNQSLNLNYHRRNNKNRNEGQTANRNILRLNLSLLVYDTVRSVKSRSVKPASHIRSLGINGTTLRWSKIYNRVSVLVISVICIRKETVVYKCDGGPNIILKDLCLFMNKPCTNCTICWSGSLYRLSVR